jgi:hypothetical protein
MIFIPVRCSVFSVLVVSDLVTSIPQFGVIVNTYEGALVGARWCFVWRMASVRDRGQ